ncbi:MAG: hypothetical protein ACJA2Q_002527 [Pseudohongiellaceae bacterium]|jgi:hypothetical protein
MFFSQRAQNYWHPAQQGSFYNYRLSAAIILPKSSKMQREKAGF